MNIFFVSIRRNNFSALTCPELIPWLILALSASLLLSPGISRAEITKAHAIALYGEPKYPADFIHFDYVNPKAPKGGKVRLMGHGAFDTLNPYTLKGISPFTTRGLYLYGFFELNEPLMVGSSDYAPSGDEPQTAYALIAESIEYPEDRRWAIFNINPAARFHDGTKITSDDVLFSFHTLVEYGNPSWQQKYADVEQVEALDKYRVKFSFSGMDTRAMPLRAAELPVMSKKFWQGRDFEKSLMEIPLGSGPYRIKEFEAGRHIVFERVKNYWGRNLPVNLGRYNFDEVRYDFYRDMDVSFEAFKSHEFDLFIDYTAKNWATGYDFPAVNEGKVIKAKLPHREAYGYQAYFINTRREQFQDPRVREALGLFMDYEWLNRSLFYSAYKRNNSYFPNTELAATGAPGEKEIALLEPYREQLPPALFNQAFQPPKTEGGTASYRKNRRKAMQLFRQAGWQVKEGQLVNRNTQAVFSIEILHDDVRAQKLILPYIKNLKQAGINATLRLVDYTQYKSSVDRFEYDMIMEVLPQSLSPSYELMGYFHSQQLNTPGAKNYSGVDSPVVDELLKKIIGAASRDELITATKALDRVLLWSYYSIPQWYAGYRRVAYWNKFVLPKVNPPYAFNFRDWWISE